MIVFKTQFYSDAENETFSKLVQMIPLQCHHYNRYSFQLATTFFFTIITLINSANGLIIYVLSLCRYNAFFFFVKK